MRILTPDYPNMSKASEMMRLEMENFAAHVRIAGYEMRDFGLWGNNGVPENWGGYGDLVAMRVARIPSIKAVPTRSVRCLSGLVAALQGSLVPGVAQEDRAGSVNNVLGVAACGQSAVSRSMEGKPSELDHTRQP